MDHDSIERLRRSSGAWRLLAGENAPLVLSFLGRVFVDENIREISEPELVSLLDDELHAIAQGHGGNAYPRSAKAYLSDWSHPQRGWLRRYYPQGSDEPHFDATPDVEMAVAWVRDLLPRDFVGTESRLSTIVDLLRQMVYGAESDPAARKAELLRRRDELDAQIARLDAGEVDVLSPVAQQDRYQQLSRMARELLSDLRQVEENFRGLDRELRARIAAWDGSKSALLDEVLGSRHSIDDSSQGQTFAAFFDFLLSPGRRKELADLLESVSRIEAVGEHDERLRYIHHDWHAAGERTQATVRILSEQLRSFLDDQAWLENRRIVDLIAGVKSRAIALRDRPPAMELGIDDIGVDVALPTDRPLFVPSRDMTLDSSVDEVTDIEIDDEAWFEQSYVDSRELTATVIGSLRHRERVDLTDVLQEAPLTQGLAELVTYLSLRDPAFRTRFDDEARETLLVDEDDGRRRSVRLPRVTYELAEETP